MPPDDEDVVPHYGVRRCPHGQSIDRCVTSACLQERLDRCEAELDDSKRVASGYQERIRALAGHYHAATRHLRIFDAALKGILSEAKHGLVLEDCRRLAENALALPKPPHPLAELHKLYREGTLFSGHPHEEYMELPEPPLPCLRCNGTGFDPQPTAPDPACRDCKGHGVVPNPV